MIGQTINTKNCGEAVITSYLGGGRYQVVFRDTGYVAISTSRTLQNSDRPRIRDPYARTVFGVGFIGEGDFDAHEKDGSDTQVYGVWRAMLRRCYYAKDAKSWRSGCTVAPEWHNFQSFASWYTENHPDGDVRYQIDKDTRFPGNRVYSPDTCVLISQKENLAARRFSGQKRGGQ